MEPSDLQLMKDWCVRRDAHAFQAIVQRHASMVFHTALRILKNRADAEDTTQECFETLAGTREMTHIRTLGAWLHGIATNRSLSNLRTSSRRSQREQQFGETNNPTQETLAWQEIYPLIDEAIQSLDERHRSPIVAHFLEGQTHAAIATELQVSRSTITNRINKGIRQVEVILKKKGVTPSLALAPILTSQMSNATPVEASLMSRLGVLALAQGRGHSAPVLREVTSTRRWSVINRGAALIAVAAIAVVATITLLMFPDANAPQDSADVTPPESTVEEETSDSDRSSRVATQAVEVVPAPSQAEAMETVVSASAVPENFPGVVYGVVVYENGGPAADVPVRLKEDIRFGKRLSDAYPLVVMEKKTDKYGRFRFESLPIGRQSRFGDTSILYLLLAQSDGWMDMKYALPHRKEKHAYLKLILKESLRRTGRVVDLLGEPVTEAKIFSDVTSPEWRARGVGQHSFFTSSDARGEFSAAIPANEPNRIRVEADGYARLTLDLERGSALPHELVLSRGHLLSGVLIDRQANAPIPGVRVSLWDGKTLLSMKTLESDEHGRIEFDGLANGEYRFVVDDSLWAVADMDRRFSITDADLVDQELLVEIGATIQGRVTDGDTGRGIQGVSIRNMSMSGARGVTDENGYYQLSGLASEKQIILNGGAPGYPQYGRYRWDTLREVVVEVVQQYSDVDFQLTKGELLTGRVIDAHGSPVAYAIVYARQDFMGGMQDDVFTDAAGRFTLCNYQKTRAIQLFARTHDQASKLLVSLKSGTPELDNLEIVLHDGATVEGEVVDGFGRPIQGANIAPRWLLGGGEPSRPLPGRPRSLSVEDGSFRLSPLPPGEFSLELLPPGTNHYINEPFAQFRLAAGEEKTDVRLVYDEREGLELSGLVTDRQGTPLKEVNVHVSGPFTTQTRSDAQGRFRVGRLPEGSYTIHARGMGFSPYVEENVPAGTTKLRILLDPSARIKGKVVNVDTDSPVKEFEILVRHGVHGRYPWGANLMFTRISGTNGAFELDDIEIGDNTVVVQASGFVTKLEPVRDLQPAGDPLELTIALTPGAVIEGTVLEPDGSPAKEAFLFVGREPDTARWNWHAIAAAKTGASGAFRIDTLPQDAEMITAYLEGFAPTTRWIPLGDTMTIKLSKGSTIEGFVTADGRPLDDSYVHVTFPGRSDVKSHGYYTDADGLFRAGELAEGTARVRADMNLGDGLFHRRSIYTSVEVAENMLSSVTIDFSQTSAVLAGTILYNDRPVPNLGVNLNIESSDGNSYHYQVPVGSDGSYTVYDIVPGIGKFQLLRQVDEDAYSGSPGNVGIDLFGNGTIEHNVILQGPEPNDAQSDNPWRASNEAFWNAWLAHIQDLASE